MATDIQQSPFIKQLAANDRPTRDKALASLQTYLSSHRSCSDLELLKIWKGLFFCIFHTDRPIPQMHLSQQLSSLIIPLPTSLFIPFLTAFYTTLSTNFSLIPSLRLDKYLYLIRRYISAAFTYLSLHAWSPTLINAYLALLQGPVGPLSRGVGDEAKVPDGLRYHVLDVWVEELVPVLKEGGEEDEVGEVLMDAVRSLGREGRGKTLRKRAKEVVGGWEKRNDEETPNADSRDEAPGPVAPSPVQVHQPNAPSDDEWEGFEN